MVSFIEGTIVSISQINSFLSDVLLLMPSNTVEEHIFLMLSADDAIVLLSIGFFSLHVELKFENESLCIWAFALMEVAGDLCRINGVKSLSSLTIFSCLISLLNDEWIPWLLLVPVNDSFSGKNCPPSSNEFLIESLPSLLPEEKFGRMKPLTA